MADKKVLSETKDAEEQMDDGWRDCEGLGP